MTNQPEEPIWSCPYCVAEIHAGSIICPYCGMSVIGSNNWPPGHRRPPDKDRAKMLWIGIAMSNLAAVILILLSGGIHSWFYPAGMAIMASEFIIAPLGMGFISAYFWRNMDLTTLGYLGYSFLNACVGLFLSALLLKEGAICLIMASPIVICFIWIGALIGSALFRANNNRLNLSLIPILLTVMVCDSLTPHHFQNTVTDTVVINAPPAQVWCYIAHFPKISEAPDYWLFRLGLPAPIQATSTGQFAGASRKCIFDHNLVLDEKIVEFEPNRRLTFDILTRPRDPEILMHLALNRGQLLLKDNGDGTTTLIGTSWYQLNVYPVCYYDLWTQSIIRNVHLRVMNHIKNLAEER